MNTFAVLLSACLVALALADTDAELNSKKESAATACKQELSVSDDDYKIAFAKATPTTESQSCFLECLYQKLGLIKDGKLNEAGAKAVAKAKYGDDQEKLAKSDVVFKKCQEEADKLAGEKCGLGKAVRICFLNNAEQLQIFPKTN